MKIKLLFIVPVLFMFSCSSPMLLEELEVLLHTKENPNEILGGIRIGDNWEEAKNKLHKDFELDKCEYLTEEKKAKGEECPAIARKVWGNYYNQLYIHFEIENDKVKSIEIKFKADKSVNRVVLRKYRENLLAALFEKNGEPVQVGDQYTPSIWLLENNALQLHPMNTIEIQSNTENSFRIDLLSHKAALSEENMYY
jgi:hypothetical protein